MERAWDLQDRFAFSWWDSLLVAGTIGLRCRYLLSEDLQDGQVVDGLTIMSPFTRGPADVLG
jgi:predicted nucleic acid-binding protein